MAHLALRMLAAGLVVAAALPAGARVVLVGIDGLGWSLADPMLAAGEMPHLAAILKRGAAAELETVEPVISPVVWTSIATGRSPGAHGVKGFMATRLQLRTPTLFERLARGGRRVGLYDYLVTWPPPALPSGFVVPGWMRRGPELWPADVWDRAGIGAYRVAYDRALTREEHVVEIRQELARKPATFTALLEAWKPDVAATILYAVDRTGHRFWRDGWPEAGDDGLSRTPPREGSLMREVLRDLDAGLGQVVAALQPDDAILLASDHGFQAGEPRHVWAGRTRDHLQHAGLDDTRDGFVLVREWGAIVARVLPGPFDARDASLERLSAFFESARGPHGERLLDVQVLDAVERPADRRRSLWNRIRQRGFRLVARYLAGASFDDPAHGWVVARFDAERMKSLWPDAEVSLAGRSMRADALAAREDFDGAHHPTAVFVAAGGPIRARSGRGRLSVLDVAPLLTYLAGEALPDDLEGSLPIDWIDPAWLEAHPPRRVPASQLPGLIPSRAMPAAEVGDPAMLERLRSLGYVE
jgi:hypothetical protein